MATAQVVSKASVRVTWKAHRDPKAHRCVKEIGRPIQRSRSAPPPARDKRLYTCAAAIMAMSQNFVVERWEAFSIKRRMVRSVKIAFSASAQWPLYAVLVWSVMPETR